eukprot:COSAG02_NODE_3478_length_6673_cov_14.589747_7_plen_75_part_00
MWCKQAHLLCAQMVQALLTIKPISNSYKQCHISFNNSTKGNSRIATRRVFICLHHALYMYVKESDRFTFLLSWR